MKNSLFTLICAALAITASAQCEFIDMSVSSSSETQVQLFTPTPFFVPEPDATMHFWDVSDSDGNTIIQETTDSDGNTFLFDHTVPLTDTILVCLSITNELAGPGISCVICDSLVWGGPILQWVITGQTGTFEATEPPIPNYFIAGQSAPCPPRTINFQNFTWGSDEVLWTFPGGDPATSTSENQLVTYDTPGDYSFTIEVFNEAGSNSFTSTDEITVFPNPVADFDFTLSGLTAVFENLSEGELNPGQTIDYLWDFGDGNTSMNETPIHTYDVEGIYQVSLSITNQCGTDEVTIEVAFGTTGIGEINAISSIEAMPNPNNGRFDLVIESQKTQQVQLRLVNVVGQTVLSQNEVLTTGSNRIGINEESLSAGIYFLDVSSDNAKRSLKVVVD